MKAVRACCRFGGSNNGYPGRLRTLSTELQMMLNTQSGLMPNGDPNEVLNFLMGELADTKRSSDPLGSMLNASGASGDFSLQLANLASSSGLDTDMLTSLMQGRK